MARELEAFMVTRPYRMMFPCVDCGEIIIGLTPRKLRCKNCNRQEKNYLNYLWRMKKVIDDAVFKERETRVLE